MSSPTAKERQATFFSRCGSSVASLPLALTLTGNYLRVQTYGGQTRRIQTTLEQLHSAKIRLHLSEPRSLINRHPSLPTEPALSLYSVIAVSDQNLRPEARVALYALSVLPCKPESFSQEAALAITDCSLDALAALIEMGLLENAADERYMQHQTIADYAYTHLSSPLPYDRLLHFASTFTEMHQTDYELLDQESSLILCALEAAFTLEKHQEFVRLACAVQGKYIQAAFYFQETVTLAQQLNRPQLMARAFYEQVNLHLKQQEIKEAEVILNEMLKIIPQNDLELQALAQFCQFLDDFPLPLPVLQSHCVCRGKMWSMKLFKKDDQCNRKHPSPSSMSW